MNKLTIIGNLVRDPETRTAKDNKSVTVFTVAVNRRQKDQNGNNIADFFRVSAWGKLGEICQKFLVKGRKVCVVGQVSVHAYTGNDNSPKASLEVFAEDVEFLSNGNSNGESTGGSAPTPVEVPDGELPF